MQKHYFFFFFIKIEILTTKKERLVPGFAIDVQVIFKPDEYKYYTDAIRIFSEVSYLEI